MNLREFIKDFRVNSLAEFRQVVTPRDEKHYRELMKHLHAMELDPVNRSDPDLMGEIRRRRMELRGWAEKNIKREDTVKEVPGMTQSANTQAAGVNHLGLPSDDVVKEDNEEFSFGQIAKAKAYAKLYVDNYTTAVKNIERIAKGLSSHPDVADALRKANEDDEPQITDYTDVVSPEEMAKIWYYDEKHGRAKDLQARFKTWQDYYKSDDFELDLDHLRSKFEDDDKDELMKKFLAKGGKIQKLKPGIPKGATHMDRRGDYKKSDFPNVKFQNRKDVEKSKSKALRSTPITSPMSDESVKEDSEASLLGAAQASLSHGLELADAVLKDDNNMAKVISSTIKENWPPLIDKIQNVYKTDSAKEELSKILNFDKKDYGLKERMPASIIKHKQKLDIMTDKELAIRFQDKDENTLRHMAWRHGYGKMSSHYWDRVQAGKQETTEDLDHLGLSIKKEDDGG